ncbi:MAG: AbrB/MazE/SpoVT family DNA-binding domain-containing protein [Promethearchaeia archaeon]
MNELKNKIKDLKKKYKRSIINLGNSKAITFPQDWTNKANLKAKSEVALYPLDDKTIVVQSADTEERKTVFKLDSSEWPTNLIRQAIISAFKLNIDEIYVKYNKENKDELYALLIDLRKEIIGLDFKTLDTQEFYVNFLLDSNKTDVPEVLSDLAHVFTSIINNLLDGTLRENNEMLLAEIDRKYSLGTRILITGLSKYPISSGYKKFPIIRFLGDRVILLYVRDFINEALNLQHVPEKFIHKYSHILKDISELLKGVVENHQRIDLDLISEFQRELQRLCDLLVKINYREDHQEENQLRDIIKYFLNAFRNFLDIGITRVIEKRVGLY